MVTELAFSGATHSPPTLSQKVINYMTMLDTLSQTRHRLSVTALRNIAVAFFLLSVPGLASGVAAQTAPDIIIGTAQTGPRLATRDDLRALAADADTLRVVVGVKLDFTPEGALDQSGLAQQRGAIATAQRIVLDGLASPREVSAAETIPFIAMSLNAADIDRLLAMPGISSIALDIPTEPHLGGSTSHVDAPALWRQSASGAGYSIAVLDTGVRRDHNAFRGKIVASACYSTTVEGRSTSLCPNGRDEQVTPDVPRAGVDCNPEIRGCGHGTHVAGIAAGNMRGNHGMARDADIVAFQVFSEFTPGECGGNSCARSWSFDQVKALERVMQWRNRYNIVAANMSLGGGSFSEPCDSFFPSHAAVISNLRSVGIATVVSSGNDWSRSAISFPACISSAIAVGNSTLQDQVSPTSNHAAQVALMAPGTMIRSADSVGNRRATRITSGTSMAAPHVAGAFAMLRSHKPDASVDEIERALICSGEMVAHVNMPKPRISMRAARAYLDRPDTSRRWAFRNERQFDQWTPVSGNWFWNNGSMRAVAEGEGALHIIRAPFCADNLEVTAQMRRTFRTDADAGTGILISSHSDQHGNFSGLLFRYIPSGDAIDVAIFAISQASAETNTAASEQLCEQLNALPGVLPDEPLTLQVSKMGNALNFIINGTEVCSAVTDARFGAGHVAMFMSAPEDSRERLFVNRVDILELTDTP